MTAALYLTVVGPIDQIRAQHICDNFAIASQQGCTELHMMLQSEGAVADDAIALANYIHGLPFAVHIYNPGRVASGAMLIYLAAHRRYVSRSDMFMLHRARLLATTGKISAADFRSRADEADLIDARCEAMIRERASLTEAMWRVYAERDLHFSAEDAVACGVAHEIRDFVVPTGGKVFNG